MRIALPFPDKLLWPNGPRARNHGHKAAVTGKHRAWAWGAAMEAGGLSFEHDGGKLAIKLIVHAKPKGPLPDEDNCVAALKAYLDGIAAAIGVNDKHFLAPTVEFQTPRDGRFVIEVG